MRRLKIIFICKLTICLLTWSVFVTELDALRGSAVVLQARAKADKKNSEPEEAVDVDENGEQVELNVTTTVKPVLTGIPQIDYVHDPNLPRELNGYNLSDYPFLNSVPEEIDFKCDGLHDGFYASMPHKCQLYHHCLFGTRFDFLCANYTAFDQKTFICHFVSQVDCPNSAKYFNRNEALYKVAETTTVSTTTTSTSTTPAPPPTPQQQQQQQQPYYPQYHHHHHHQQQQQMLYEGRRAMSPGFAQSRKRRPAYRRRRPVYEYYYVDDYDDQQEYYDESIEQMPMAKKPIRKHSRLNNYKPIELEVDYSESNPESDIPAPSGNFKKNKGTAEQQQQQPQQQQEQQQQQRQRLTVVTKNVSNQITSVYNKPRAPPKIRRPVPINERDRYDYASASKLVEQPAPAVTTTTTTETPSTKSSDKGKEQEQPEPEEPVEYYDDDEEVPEDEYSAEPEALVVVKPAAASKPEPIKPTKVTARTAVMVDYDADHGRRSSTPEAQVAGRPKVNYRAALTPVLQPQPLVAAAHKKPAAASDDYEDELPAATTAAARQSIAATTKQRASGPFLVRQQKPMNVRVPSAPVAVADDREESPVYQQPRQPQRISVRQVMMATGAHRYRQQQQSAVADHPVQYNGNKQIRAAASTANRRPPVRSVYEYADEYYDE